MIAREFVSAYGLNIPLARDTDTHYDEPELRNPGKGQDIWGDLLPRDPSKQVRHKGEKERECRIGSEGAQGERGTMRNT